MSRSFKHTPIGKSGGPGWRRFSKRYANKIMRRYVKENIDADVDGKFHRRVYETWDIYDQVSYTSIDVWKDSEYYRRTGDLYEWFKYFHDK